MSEERSSINEGGVGCFLSLALGLSGLVATCMLGPIDLTRTVYNQVVGDTPILKKDLVNYIRRDIRTKNPNFTSEQAEAVLINEIEYNKFSYGFEDGQINPLYTETGKLWDASEKHARSGYQRWVW